MIDAGTAATVTSGGYLSERMSHVAVGLPSVHGCGAIACQHVQPMGLGDDVTFTRTHASRVPTGVVEVQPFRDRADHELVHDSMGSQEMLLAIVQTLAPDEPVSEFIAHPIPEPAAICLGESTPSFAQGSGLGSCHTSIVTMKPGM